LDEVGGTVPDLGWGARGGGIGGGADRLNRVDDNQTIWIGIDGFQDVFNDGSVEELDIIGLQGWSL